MVSSEVCLQPSPEGVIISYLLSFQPKGAAVTKPGQVSHTGLHRCAKMQICILAFDTGVLLPFN